MGLQERLHATATRLINKYGYNKVKYVRQAETTQGWRNQFYQEFTTVDVAIVPSSKYSKETYRVNGAKDMADSNYVGYIAHTDFIPTINDKIITDSKEFTIVSVVEYNPNGSQQIMYKLELK